MFDGKCKCPYTYYIMLLILTVYFIFFNIKNSDTIEDFSLPKESQHIIEFDIYYTCAYFYAIITGKYILNNMPHCLAHLWTSNKEFIIVSVSYCSILFISLPLPLHIILNVLPCWE